MIIVDFMHLSFKSLYVALGKNAYSKDKINFSEYKGMFIHLMFNYFKLIQNDFVKDYGDDIVLALEGTHSWRKSFYPEYKANRKLNDVIDWENEVFPLINEIIDTVKSTLPFKTVRVAGAEGDDVIATLANNASGPVLIISEDKDFIQLLKKTNIILYRPIKKEFLSNISESEIQSKLTLHILIGDKVDNIPSIMEGTTFTPDFIKYCQDNNIFESNVENFRKLEIGQTLMDNFSKNNIGKTIYKPAYFGEKTAQTFAINLQENLSKNTIALENFERNRTLIDFDYIPDDIKEKIISEYNNCKVVSNLEVLMRYFLKYGCKKHAEDISSFRGTPKIASSAFGDWI